MEGYTESYFHAIKNPGSLDSPGVWNEPIIHTLCSREVKTCTNNMLNTVKHEYKQYYGSR
jgi:hypothetical protein